MVLLNRYLLTASLLFVVDAQVAVLADSLGVKGTLSVLAFGSQLCAALGMITVLAHSVGIVLFTSVGAL